MKPETALLEFLQVADCVRHLFGGNSSEKLQHLPKKIAMLKFDGEDNARMIAASFVPETSQRAEVLDVVS
jgi:hypothetical protein